MKKILSNRLNREYGVSVCLATAVFFMLCIYEPLNMYFLNKIDYICDMYTILPECLGMFVALTVISSILLLLLNLLLGKHYIYVITMLVWGYACLYIQGNYMISNLPVLDGQTIDWSIYYSDMFFSTLFWIIMFAICIVALKFLGKDRLITIGKYLSVFITLVLIVTLITVGVANNGFERRIELASTSKNMLEYSEDTNFILLVMDSMSSEVENQVLEKYPEYADAFSDFTYYDNVSATYLYTTFALPYLYGGEAYKGEENFNNYLDRIYLQSDFVKELENQDFRLQAYTDAVPLNDEQITKYENVIDYKAEVVNHVDFCKVLLRMSGFKYAPYPLKMFTQVLPNELNEHLKKPTDIRVLNFFNSNIPFYKECTQSDFTLSKDKCFKLIHLAAAHYPFEYTKDVELIPYSSYEDNMACSNTIIETYLEKLKEEGVYDNSIIFITADHSISEDNDTYKRINPVLFVKGLNEHHDKLQINHAPIAHDDFPEAYNRLLNGASSQDIFDWKEGDLRERTIYFEDEQNNMLIEYIQYGDAWDKHTLQETGTTYQLK